MCNLQFDDRCYLNDVVFRIAEPEDIGEITKLSLNFVSEIIIICHLSDDVKYDHCLFVCFIIKYY